MANESYQDEYWVDLASLAEQKHGVPNGLLQSILLHGERSNPNQVSEAGARTPFQIIPKTRSQVLKKYGVDAYLSPETSAEVAAILLKESLDRNDGSVGLAAAEYHGGLDRRQWGQKTSKYVDRVLNGVNEINAATKKLDDSNATSMQNMEVSSAEPQFRDSINVNNNNQVFNKLYQAYLDGKMTQEEAREFKEDIKQGFDFSSLSNNTTSNNQSELQNGDAAENNSIINSIQDMFTGNLRKTQTTESLQDWANMPELNDISVASLKAALGTMATNPEETATVLKSNFPNVEISQDEKGNYLLKSSIDGNIYAIKPGFQVSDIPRVAGSVLAFTPASKAATVLGRAAASGVTQGVIEGTQAATGGSFDTGDVVSSVIASPIADMAASIVNRGLNKIQKPKNIKDDSAQDVIKEKSISEISPEEQTNPVDLFKKYASGKIDESAVLDKAAELVAPDKDVVGAAKRLKIDQYLDPDQISTNQAFIELSQALKSIPSSAFRASERENLKKIGERANEIVKEIGATDDLSLLNDKIKNNINDTIDELTKESNEIYKFLNTNIKKSERFRPASVLEFITERSKDLGGKENLSSMEKNILNRFTKIDKKTQDVINPTYGLIDEVRKEVGASLKGAGPFSDADTGLSKKIYQLLTDDSIDIVKSLGFAKEAKKAKKLVALRKGFENDMVTLFGKKIDQSFVGKLINSSNRLSSGDVDSLKKVLMAIPNDLRQESVASSIKYFFGKTIDSGDLNFNTFSKWYSGLRKNSQAYNLIMSSFPTKTRMQLRDLFLVSNAINKANANKISTGRLSTVKADINNVDSIMNNLYNIAKRSFVGVPIEAITTSVGAPGAGIAAGITSALSKNRDKPIELVEKIISSDAFKNMAINRVSRSSVVDKKSINSFLQSSQLKNFLNYMKVPLKERERYVYQIILGFKQFENK